MANGKRVYNSPLREEQARRTRATVLDAAERCFLEHGYGATTMKDIATAAGVSAPTVFGYGNKATLLLHCVDRSVVGDDEEVALLERDEFARLLGDTPLDEKLAALHAFAATNTPRSAPMLKVFASAAAADPAIAESYAEYGRRRHEDTRAMVAAFQRWMRPGVDIDTATDVCWAIFSHDAATALMDERGWSAERWADWVVDTLQRLFLDPSQERPARTRRNRAP